MVNGEAVLQEELTNPFCRGADEIPVSAINEYTLSKGGRL
jgi:hypothetical protein